MSKRARIITFVRYSVVLDDPKAFLAGRQSRDEYVRTILNPARLRTRQHLFSNLTLASLAAQNLDASWFRLCVLVSDNLPTAARAALEGSIRPYPWAKIELWRDLKDITTDTLSEMSGAGAYATLRLDDDDGLGRDFIERVSTYCRPELADHAVSFCAGYSARFDEAAGYLVEFAASYKPYLAIGLAHIGMFDGARITSRKAHIFDAGRHSTLDRKIPVIVNAAFPAWVRTLYASQDTGAVSHREFDEKSKVQTDEVLRHVRIGDALVR